MKRIETLAFLSICVGCRLAAADDALVRVVPAGGLPDAQQPQVAVTERGTVYVVYGSGHSVYCSVSSDGGKSFSDPAKVGAVGALALGMRRGPRFAASERAVTVTAVGGQLGGGKDGDVLAWRSTDGGVTWLGPVPVNDETGSAREGLHGMAGGPKGELFCVWLDLRNRKTELYGAASHDGGATWSRNQLVYRSPEGSICECCHPAVTFDAQGGLYVMWRNQLAGARDMYLIESHDGGKTFGSATKLGQGTWPLKACPMDGGAVAATAPRRVATVWMREKQVFRTGGGPAEQLLGRGEQPWATAGPNGTYFVWITRRPGELFVLTPNSRQPRQLATGAIDPAIGAPLTGKGPVVAVWESGQRGSGTVMATVVGSSR